MRNAFIKELTELARQDKDVVLVTGDLGFSVFEAFQKDFPGQYMNAGLCEQSMIGMAAGMALEGKKVFVYSIIPFLTFRALEQIRNDLCYQQLPVKLVGVGSGFVYGALGGTHHAIEDVGVMTTLPQMTVFSPGDPFEVSALIRQSMAVKGPCYIRLNRGGDPVVHASKEYVAQMLRVGEPLATRAYGEDVAIFAVGHMNNLAAQVAEDLNQQGIKASSYSAHTLKPVDKKSLLTIAQQAQRIVVLEEIVAQNSFASTLSRVMIEEGVARPVLFFALPDEFTHAVGSQAFLEKEYGLHKEHILKRVLNSLVSTS